MDNLTCGQGIGLEAKPKQDPNITVANIGQDLSNLNVLARTAEGELVVGGIAYHSEVLRQSLIESPVSRRYAYHDPLAGADPAWCAKADFRLHGLGNYGLHDTLYHILYMAFPEW